MTVVNVAAFAFLLIAFALALFVAWLIVRLAHVAGGVQVELRGLSERVSTVEKGQQQASQGLLTLGTGVAETGSVARGVAEAAAAIRDELARAKTDLTALQSYARARQELERRTADSIHRLEAIIAGTQSRGAAGENILEVAFAKLPAEWQVRDLRIGNKAVEFALRLPNGLLLPIDSKWAATGLLEAFVNAEDQGLKQRLKADIEIAVLAKAKEVRKYIDPSLTVGFGIAAVPDAVYDLCSGAQVEAFQQSVVLVSYSLFLPYLLLVFQTTLKATQQIDLQKLDAYLRSAQDSLQAVQGELEGRYARALTMLGNARDDMSVQLSKVRSSLTSLELGASTPLSQVATVPASLLPALPEV